MSRFSTEEKKELQIIHTRGNLSGEGVRKNDFGNNVVYCKKVEVIFGIGVPIASPKKIL